MQIAAVALSEIRRLSAFSFKFQEASSEIARNFSLGMPKIGMAKLFHYFQKVESVLSQNSTGLIDVSLLSFD
jgi:hypothetical protein